MDKALDKGNDNDLNVFKINENYAKRFEHNKKREFLENTTKKYGEKRIFEREEDDSENDVSEDSNAELINPRVMEKFISAIVKIQDDKGAKELLETKDFLFNEEDFEYDNDKPVNDKGTKITVKEMLLKTDNDDEDNIYSINYKPKVKTNSELNNIKNELLEAAKLDKNLETQGDEEFLVKKIKNKDDDEDDEDSQKSQKDIEEMDLDDIINVNY